MFHEEPCNGMGTYACRMLTVYNGALRNVVAREIATLMDLFFVGYAYADGADGGQLVPEFFHDLCHGMRAATTYPMAGGGVSLDIVQIDLSR